MYKLLLDLIHPDVRKKQNTETEPEQLKKRPVLFFDQMLQFSNSKQFILKR